MKNILLIIILLVGLSPKAQSLSKELWSYANCISEFDTEEETRIDEASKGYIYIQNGDCEQTIAAYKSNLGSYTIFATRKKDCAWEYSTICNRNIEEILPEGFNVNLFFEKVDLTQIERNYFYYEIQLPRHGTDTKLVLKLKPLGLAEKGKDLATFNYSEANAYRYNGVISDEEKSKIYNLYKQIKHPFIILSWNREKARFTIKQLGEKAKLVNKEDFFKQAIYYSPCQ